MSQKKIKQARRLVKVVRKLLEDDYYIFPREVLKMENLPFYKKEFMNKLERKLKDE